MTKRELLRRLLESENDLDSTATVRLVRRNNYENVTHAKTVEITYVRGGQFTVEEEFLDSAQRIPT